ncbi:MAG TPA: hypothetical protein VNI57_01360 [Candidatus Saccharimonadales bacterium]|nr:hypothetical protein [Candidatus Saccharimonadales bacterium]
MFTLRARRRVASGPLSLILAVAAGAATAAFAAEPAPKAAEPVVEPTADIVETLTGEASRLGPWVTTDLAREFLGAAPRLPRPPARTIFRDPGRRYYSPEAAAALPDPDRAALEKIDLAPETYYTTRYGTPLAYVRPIEILGRHGMATFAGKRVLDFGYGTIGHLAMMASLGAEAVGVDVDSYLSALYSEGGDQGPRPNPKGVDGMVRLVDGHWPGTDSVKKAVGGGFDLFISKNVLKRGYIHPDHEVDPSRLVHLEVDDATFLSNVRDSLVAGGLFMIYNLSPAQNPPGKPWLPWADGRCPFTREQLTGAGFEVLVYDEDDTAAAREMGRRLGWDKKGMDLDKDLFGHVTLVRKPPAPPRGAGS